MPIGHYRKGKADKYDAPYDQSPYLEGKLVVKGDPSSLLML